VRVRRQSATVLESCDRVTASPPATAVRRDAVAIKSDSLEVTYRGFFTRCSPAPDCGSVEAAMSVLTESMQLSRSMPDRPSTSNTKLGRRDADICLREAGRRAALPP